MNKYLSEKLKVISFFSMIMVVFLHSYNPVIKSQSETIILKKGYSVFIQDFFSQGITRIAVPLFFAISGYLFFLKMEGTFNEYILKFKKRLQTLALPYFFWSLWGLLFYFVLQSLPQSRPFFTNDLIKGYSFGKLMSTFILNPIPYQLWFVRNLIIIICITPILYWLLRNLKTITLIFFLTLWVFNANLIFVSSEALLFFVIGAFMGIYSSKLLLLNIAKGYRIFTFLWVTLVLFKTILGYVNLENTGLLIFLDKTSIVIGILAVWSLYDMVFQNKTISSYSFYSFTSLSFFLYAFHEPILTICKKGLFYFMGKEELASLLIYIIAPLITIFISILTGYYLKKNIPKFYGVITGGR